MTNEQSTTPPASQSEVMDTVFATHMTTGVAISEDGHAMVVMVLHLDGNMTAAIMLKPDLARKVAIDLGRHAKQVEATPIPHAASPAAN